MQVIIPNFDFRVVNIIRKKKMIVLLESVLVTYEKKKVKNYDWTHPISDPFFRFSSF